MVLQYCSGHQSQLAWVRQHDKISWAWGAEYEKCAFIGTLPLFGTFSKFYNDLQTYVLLVCLNCNK